MTIAAGTRLGPYEVTALIGVGGMGEVYRATDTNLKRQVAIKVLPVSVSTDAERLARFQREAEVLASLNHPGIAAIYGLERTPATTALVMEFVDGPTLAERIASGAIRLETALLIARQIAEALETAHERGIVHRDLKPGNVKVRPDGTVKVLDFGLAKVLEPAPAAPGISQSPTVTASMMTTPGAILGTPAYMSPEQLRGQPVDRRADVWAFGCVLFELVAGRAPFAATSTADTVAAIMERDPDWTLLPPSTPPALKRLLKKCLAKDPRFRLRSVGDAALEVDELLTDTSHPPGLAPRTRWALSWMTIAAVAASAIAAIATLAWRARDSAPPSDPGVIRYSIDLPAEQQFESTVAGLPAVLAVSSDGRQIAYSARSAAGNRLYRRSRGELESSLISGTEGALGPFFSPDDQWIGFVANGAIRKVPVSGGTPQTIVSALNVIGATWGADDTIVWGEWAEGLFKVSADGGARQPFTRLVEGRGEVRHGSPHFSPDGKLVFFAVYYREAAPDLAVADLATGTRRILASGDGAYLHRGQLVFSRAGTLFAASFDADQLVVQGQAAQLLDGVSAGGQPQFALAADGTLVYVPAPSNRRRLVWVDRTGKSIRAIEKEDRFSHPRISPDGDRLLMQVLSARGGNEFWIHDSTRASDIRLSVQGSRPIWEPDGARITYQNQGNLYSVPVDDSRTSELLVALKAPANFLFPLAWSRDGVLVFSQPAPETNRDVFTVRRGEPARPFLTTPRDERSAMLSPDGRWMVYAVREVGREEEVYVQAYPSGERRQVVSAGGGIEPVWSPTGKEIFYRSTDGSKLLAVDVTTEPTFHVGTPRTLFAGRFPLGTSFWADYDVSPDGTRFLMLEAADELSTRLNVVMNLFRARDVSN